jgi:mono/diheme cytochrome c family protein
MRRFLVVAFGLVASVGVAETTYLDHVRPLFKEHCLNCHNPDKMKADLDLSTFAGVMKGGSGGEVVKAGVPDSSFLYLSVIHHEDSEPMPPKKPKLADAKLQLIRNWILGGLVEAKGGKSQLRKIEFEVASGSSGKPEGPAAVPVGLAAATERSGAAMAHKAMAVSPWAPLAAVARIGEIEFLDMANDGASLGAVPFPEGDVFVLKFSRNGSLLLAAGGRGAHTGKVVLYDVETGKRIAEIGDEQDAIMAADVSADHRFVAIGTTSKIVKIFEVRTGKMLHRIKRHTDWVTSVAFAPDDDRVTTGDRNGGIHVWEAEKGGIVLSLSDHKERITQLVWRSDGKMLASAAEDGKMILWDMKDGWPSKVVDAHKPRDKNSNRYTRTTGVLSLDWSRNGELMTVGRDRIVRLWKADGNRLYQFPPLDTLPTVVRAVDESQQFVVGTFDGQLRLGTKDRKSKELLPLR